jgi:hypothetical protein
MRNFQGGATRNLDGEQYDYEGFLSPLALKAFGEYMHRHRLQADGSLRDSDNWQKGIPLDSYIKSGWRHFMDWWGEHRKAGSRHGMEEALCGLLFNVMGYLHEYKKKPSVFESVVKEMARDKERERRQEAIEAMTHGGIEKC